MTCTPACRKPNGNQAHCGAAGCHETFAGITVFDAHRTGHVDERRCRPPADCGMRLNAWGVWSQSGEGRPAYWDRPPVPGGTETAETPPGVPAPTPEPPEAAETLSGGPA